MDHLKDPNQFWSNAVQHPVCNPSWAEFSLKEPNCIFVVCFSIVKVLLFRSCLLQYKLFCKTLVLCYITAHSSMVAISRFSFQPYPME